MWARPQGRASCGGGGVRYMSKANGVRPPIGGATTSDPLRPPRPPCDPQLGPRPGGWRRHGSEGHTATNATLAVTIMLTYLARCLVRASRSPHFIIRGQSRGVRKREMGRETAGEGKSVGIKNCPREVGACQVTGVSWGAPLVMMMMRGIRVMVLARGGMTVKEERKRQGSRAQRAGREPAGRSLARAGQCEWRRRCSRILTGTRRNLGQTVSKLLEISYNQIPWALCTNK